MSFQLNTVLSFKDLIAAKAGPVFGMFLCSGEPGSAEICAEAGFDYLLIDAEHGPLGLESILAQLRAIAGSHTPTLVRVPANDPVFIKQVLELGVNTIIVPMVDTPEEAKKAVSSAHYPPLGVRGVGAALARSARWNRDLNYLNQAREKINVLVQIESSNAIANSAAISAVDGIDGIFIGPADLAASMGLLGQQNHPEVVQAVFQAIVDGRSAGKIVGVNAFGEEQARIYLDAGANFVNVGADVSLLAHAADSLANTYLGTNLRSHESGY